MHDYSLMIKQLLRAIFLIVPCCFTIAAYTARLSHSRDPELNNVSSHQGATQMSVASSADMMQHILNGSNMGLQFDFNGI